MKEITKEALDAAVDKALVHIEMGPFGTLRDWIDAGLAKAGVTREQMLERAAQRGTPPQGLAAKYGPAMNDNGSKGSREEYLDGLANACEAQESLRRAATVYAACVLNHDDKKAIWDEASTILRDVGLMGENVEGAPTFAARKNSVQMRQNFTAIIQELVESPIPGLQVGVERFEQAIRAEFREKGI